MTQLSAQLSTHSSAELSAHQTKKLINDSENNSMTSALSSDQQTLLRNILEQGLPLVAEPYQVIADQIMVNELDVIEQIKTWKNEGLIKRFGLVVKHRQLGYTANAMVVWNIETNKVDEIAKQLSKRDEISLCYRRPRRLPDWPYNLFCMIHGKSREQVKQQIQLITQSLNLQTIEKDILFSTKAYKQHGARYGKTNTISQASSPAVSASDVNKSYSTAKTFLKETL